jgi:hypothetical protein
MESIIILIVVILILGIIFYFSQIQSKKRAELKLFQERQFKEFEDQIQKYQDEFNLNGLPIYDPQITFPKSEKVHGIIGNVEWREFRKVRTGRVVGHGVTGRVKITKGVYYRFGTGQYSQESVDQIKSIDFGDLYITNKKLFFRGSNQNKSIPYNSIIEISPSIDGMVVEKDKGKDVYLAFDAKLYPKQLVAACFAYQL